jgi:hypothetical protein
MGYFRRHLTAPPAAAKPPTLTELLRRRLENPEYGSRLTSATASERVIESLVIKAMGGDADAARLIFDRIDGPQGTSVQLIPGEWREVT